MSLVAQHIYYNIQLHNIVNTSVVPMASYVVKIVYNYQNNRFSKNAKVLRWEKAW